VPFLLLAFIGIILLVLGILVGAMSIISAGSKGSEINFLVAIAGLFIAFLGSLLMMAASVLPMIDWHMWLGW